MKALMITPENKTIVSIEISGLDDIVKLIGFDSIISDAIDNNGDHLYFDEDCFLRGSEGRFQIDTLVPVSGIGIIVGVSDDATLRDVTVDIDDISGRIKYL